MMLSLLNLLLLFYSTNFSHSTCRESYITICDSVSDVPHNPQRKFWTALLIKRNFNNTPSYTLTSRQLPSELSRLEWLIIDEQLVKIESNAFSSCKNLQHLILHANDVKTISRSTFLGFKNLTKLSLRSSNVKELRPKAFILSNIHTVDLSDNNLESLVGDTFRKCTVTTLRVTNNKLGSIESNSIPTSVEHLHLDHNVLDTIPQELENLNQLKELTLSHNNLKNVDVNQLPTLKKLDLSFNNIITISREFNNLVKLKYLDLCNNKIEKFIFTTQFVQNVRGQFVLLLAHNRLMNLDLGALSQAEVTVSLSGNPWSCKCMDQMLEIIKNSSITNTICDRLTISSGMNPYCFADGSQRCSESRISETDLEKFQEAAVNKICDVFGDVDSFVE